MPFSGRGHINPGMNLCKLLASRKPDILITFVVTEEWLGCLSSEPKPNDPSFYEAVMTEMETPFEEVLDHLDPPVTAIIEMDNLKATFPFPVYHIGPAIPYLELEVNSSGDNHSTDYQKWLDSQPEGSVLYISLGSFLSVSETQMEEVVAGLQDSGVWYIWVARGEASRLKEIVVISHSPVGGFWTRCGCNSTLESVFSRVPMLTLPLFLDRDPNKKQIVEEWRVDERSREEWEKKIWRLYKIAELIQKFMELETDVYQLAITEGGSSVTNLDVFIRNILQGNCH
ncbi:hypothetical protein P3X46_012775 [Hevea brasiliensis]|uniref:Uncharacterized protein n=1 Tax=Hevea brasiliensis TaxID=3981 RepID=A0ABQ9MDY4_HEVBR|nr:hypothetical protein P3X46_012775 [Hevea brasiliensis]